MSFYDNSESDFQENHVKNEQLLVLQSLSKKSHKVETTEEHRDMEYNDGHGIERVKATFISTNNSSKKMDTTYQNGVIEDNGNGIETIEVTYISPNNSQKEDTQEQHRDMEVNDENGIDKIEVKVETKNEIATTSKRIRGKANISNHDKLFNGSCF